MSRTVVRVPAAPPKCRFREVRSRLEGLIPLVHQDDRRHDDGDAEGRIIALESFGDRECNNRLAGAGDDLDRSALPSSEPRLARVLLPTREGEAAGEFPTLWEREPISGQILPGLSGLQVVQRRTPLRPLK